MLLVYGQVDGLAVHGGGGGEHEPLDPGLLHGLEQHEDHYTLQLMPLTDLYQIDGARHVVLIIPQWLGHTFAHRLQSREVNYTRDSVLAVAVNVKNLKL